MAPHMARFVLRGGQVALLCGSALIGALLVLATDTLGRLAFAPLQIPAGIVIALVGCPFLLLCFGVAVTPCKSKGLLCVGSFLCWCCARALPRLPIRKPSPTI